MRKRLGLIAAGTALVIASGTAVAGSDVHFGISIGVPVAPAPVYVAPPPVVYYPPAPRVYYEPARVYYAPAYYSAPVVVKHKHGHGHKHRHGRHHRHW